MTKRHDILTNFRLWSVQAGLIGGAFTAFLAALQQSGLHIPPVLTAASGVLTAAGVFGARMIAQPDVTGDPKDGAS